MPADFRIDLGQIAEIERYLGDLPKRINDAAETYLRSHAQEWLMLLRAVIQHVVYDAYTPTKYKRREDKPLISLTDVETRRFVREVVTSLFNDSTKMEYRPRADGSIGPRGGAQPHEVPWQIETGGYPLPWYGMARPRAAYEITAAQMWLEIGNEISEAIGQALRA